MATLIRTDRNGTKYFEGEINCDRCDGKGIYIIGVCNGKPVPSWVDNGVCFKCGGSGKVYSKWKEYTPEYEEKLFQRRKARSEKWQQEHAEEIARAEAERIAQEKAEAEEKERKAKSQHIGNVGDKVDMDVILEKRAWFEIPSFRGFGTDTMNVYTFRDDKGDAIVWKTTRCIPNETGSRVHLKGTIKELSEYKDEKQTILIRCKVAEA